MHVAQQITITEKSFWNLKYGQFYSSTLIIHVSAIAQLYSVAVYPNPSLLDSTGLLRYKKTICHEMVVILLNI